MSFEYHVDLTCKGARGLTETFWLATTFDLFEQMQEQGLTNDAERMDWLLARGAKIDRADGPAYTAVRPNGAIEERLLFRSPRP